jgi:multidrug efflux pump subunit AcrA (membrane-fusion protein)
MAARRHKLPKKLLNRVTMHFTVVVIGAVVVLCGCGPAPSTSTASASNPSTNASKPDNRVELSPDQLTAIKIEPLGTYLFTIEKRGVGSVDFDSKLYFDNNLSRPAFPPQSGKIINTLAELGDQVQKGQPLYTISAPRERELAVGSPITGQVTSVNASPGLQVEPGKAPAPYAVADVSTKWMVGNVAESDSTFFQIGQPVEVRVATYSDRAFEGKIIKVYPAVDVNTHRVMIRSEIADPANELRSGMLADFVVRVRQPNETTAVPVNSVVREPDGTMTVWVTSDRHRFSQRVIKTGLREDDRVEVTEGLQSGELVVTEGAIFLSNLLQAPPSD